MFSNQSNTTDTLNGEIVSLTEHRDAVRNGRRRLIAGIGAAGALAGAAALTGCADDSAVPAPNVPTGPSVVDVLNFALNLEYLEASFYLYVSTGTGLSAADMGSGAGSVTGGAKVNFSNATVSSVANQLATDEREHVEFLRSTISSIGGTPVPMPSINLAAGGAVTSDTTFLAAARQLENVGVSAYIGGAQYLVSSAAALTYAARILDTEAQHAGFVRELCINLGVASPAVDSLDHPPTATQIFDVDPSTGLAPVRTTSQVLQIVYGKVGSTGVSSGGFFPSGLNGNIHIS